MRSQLVTLWGFPCMLFVAFYIFSLSLIFVTLINVCLIVLLWFILYGTLCFLNLSQCFPSHVREVSSYNGFKYFPRLFLFSFWNLYNVNIGVFYVVPEVSETFLFIFFSLFCSTAETSITLSSSSLIGSSASCILLFISF